MQDDPYFTNPSGYDGRHRDDSAQARADAVKADFAYLTASAGASPPRRAQCVHPDVGGGMSDILFSGSVTLHTASWVVPDDSCPDCESGRQPVDDGGTYLTVRIPSQDFPVSLGHRVELTITDGAA